MILSEWWAKGGGSRNARGTSACSRCQPVVVHWLFRQGEHEVRPDDDMGFLGRVVMPTVFLT
ncbi:MAG: hypothetical protein HC933_14895 [Pleurocapsa sp. SU_196_0]|nr:hypothetical protein [Pleurocapsa sp. SU_196_0]